MPKKIKTVLKIFGVLVAAVLVFAVGLIGLLTITEYKPEPVETIPVAIAEDNGQENPKLNETIRVLTFNIGYCNLGKESDFFMDGGKNTRNGDENLVLKNLDGVMETMEEIDADILLIQEVDADSHRSFDVNQMYAIQQEFGGRNAIARNYNCIFVPFPLPPLGKVASGIMTQTDFAMKEAERISLPCPFSWPVSTANLKRCLLVSRFDIENSDKELVVVNLHLEAYDDGEGKIAQTKMLLDVLETEYNKGNYVIAGGDFNQTFSGAVGKYPLLDPDFWVPGVLDEEELPEGWRYIYDDSNPTCRLLNKPYDEASAQHYVIDGFIVSPNVETLSVKTIKTGFEYADHSPVVMDIKLK